MGEVEEGEGEDTLWEYDDIGMVAISEGLKNLNRGIRLQFGFLPLNFLAAELLTKKVICCYCCQITLFFGHRTMMVH